MGRAKVKCFWPKVPMFILMQAIEQDITVENKQSVIISGSKRASSVVHFDASIVLDFRYITYQKFALQELQYGFRCAGYYPAVPWLQRPKAYCTKCLNAGLCCVQSKFFLSFG